MTYVAHWDDASRRERHFGDIHGDWADLGDAAGTVRVGLRRIRIRPGARSTPAHVHGAEEEIFYVLGGSGLLWQDGEVCEVRAGDTIAHPANTRAHTLRAGDEGMDVLAFGNRVPIELCFLPRTRHAWAGPTVIETMGMQNLFRYDEAAGELEFPEPGERPPNVVALEDVEPMPSGPSGRIRLDLGTAAGSRFTGLKRITSDPGKLICIPHCHSAEEELFVVLEGTGTCELGDETVSVRPGSLVARPAGTGVAHALRAGDEPLSVLAYGTREPNDICYYPRSGKVYLCGIGVIGRITPVDYWEDEEL